MGLLLLVSTLLSLAYAETPSVSPTTSFEYTNQIRQDLEAIKSIPPESFSKEVDGLRSKMEKYIDHKKRVCNGEFSTFILETSLQEPKKVYEEGEETPRQKVSNKLSAEERRLCFRELKALQVTLVNNMFTARKRYLEFLHKERIKELELARVRVIKELKDSFVSKRSRRKRRKSKR